MPAARDRLTLLAAIAAGGALGAATRYGLGLVWPEPPGTGFPWTTFAINVSGCLALGALVAGLDLLSTAHRLARPAIGTGFFGGYTTFSTYVEQSRALIAANHPQLALAYLAGTLAAALTAAWLGLLGVRTAARIRRTATREPSRALEVDQ